jgi:hypothetical protein
MKKASERTHEHVVCRPELQCRPPEVEDTVGVGLLRGSVPRLVVRVYPHPRRACREPRILICRPLPDCERMHKHRQEGLTCIGRREWSRAFRAMPSMMSDMSISAPGDTFALRWLSTLRAHRQLSARLTHSDTVPLVEVNRRLVLVLLHPPLAWRVDHAELLALVKEQRPALADFEQAQQLRRLRPPLHGRVPETRDRPGVVVILDVDRVPEALAALERLPAVDDGLHLGKLPRTMFELRGIDLVDLDKLKAVRQCLVYE